LVVLQVGHILFDASFMSLLPSGAHATQGNDIVLDFGKFHHARALKPVNHRGV